ncbi:hypothetical protein EIMP300_88360 [Escherichia coli]|uniref:succinate dehydrogenase n=1 Tax=Escherichia coli TaxID=562 RepID=A0A8S0G3S6_ECOLX|nr:hypothetical protein EIMP300_88360 [Escherichia coli]
MGECSSVGLHGANRLGSNSLAELVVFGRLAGEQATERAATAGNGNEAAIEAQAAGVEQRLKDLVNQDGGENWAKIRDEMGMAMEEGCGIYRTPELMQKTIDKLAELQERFKRVRITDTSSVFNTDLLYTIELGHGLNVAECMAHSAMARKESRGAHQRTSHLGATSVWTKVAPSVTTSTSSNTPSPSAMLMARLAWSTAT